MIYRILKVVVILALRVFFKKIVVTGREHMLKKGPLIIAANHPNTLMDPLIVASLMSQQIGFVGNASIFSNALVARILRGFKVIPIYRKKDVTDGAPPDNRFAFSKCHEFLGQGGTLLIFPEGTSIYELKLREIKTGTARIALSYAAQPEWGDDLQILPVSLDYSDAIQFRSSLSVTVSPPIAVADQLPEYEQDAYTGVNALTEAIRKKLARHIPHTQDKAQERFLKDAHTFYTEYVDASANLFSHPRRSLIVRKALATALMQLQQVRPPLYAELEQTVNQYFQELHAQRLSPGFFNDQFRARSPWLVQLGYVLTLVLLLPVYVIGLLTNYLPYILPGQLFKALRIDIEYRTSVTLVAGILLFPLYYYLMLLGLSHYVPLHWWTVLGAIAVFASCGYGAMYYYTEWTRWRRVTRFYHRLSGTWKAEMQQRKEQIMRLIREAEQWVEVREGD